VPVHDRHHRVGLAGVADVNEFHKVAHRSAAASRAVRSASALRVRELGSSFSILLREILDLLELESERFFFTTSALSISSMITRTSVSMSRGAPFLLDLGLHRLYASLS